MGAQATIGFSDSIELNTPTGDILVLEGSALRTATGGPNNHIVLQAPEGEVDVHSLPEIPSTLASPLVEIDAACSHVDDTVRVESQNLVSPHHCDEGGSAPVAPPGNSAKSPD